MSVLTQLSLRQKQESFWGVTVVGNYGQSNINSYVVELYDEYNLIKQSNILYDWTGSGSGSYTFTNLSDDTTYYAKWRGTLVCGISLESEFYQFKQFLLSMLIINICLTTKQMVVDINIKLDGIPHTKIILSKSVKHSSDWIEG